MMTRLVETFGLLAFAWGNTQAIAIPLNEYVAQVTAGTGINRPSLKAGSQETAVSELQAVLKLLGYYTGVVDGVYGQSTATAVSQFQKAAGLNPDGSVNSATWERLFPPVPVESSAAAFPVPATTTTPPPAANTSAPNTPRVTNPKPAQTPASTSTASTPKPAKTPTSTSTASTPKPAKTPTSTEVTLPVLRLAMEGAAVKKLQQRLQVFGLFKGSVDGVFGSQTEIAVKALQSRYRLNPDGVVGSATWKLLNRQPPRRR